MNFSYKIFIYTSIIFLLSCGSDEIVQYFEYPDHNVLNIGSLLTDFIMTNDSNTLIAADKGNNRVLFIDVSTDNMVITKSVWVGSEPTSLDFASNSQYLLVGLQGASSISVVSMETMSLLGSIPLDLDNIFDIEYVDLTDQLIVSYLSSNSGFRKTKVYRWLGAPWDATNLNNDVPSLINYTVEVNVNGIALPGYTNEAGSITVSDDEQYVYVLSAKGPPFKVYRFEIISEGGLNVYPPTNIVESTHIADGDLLAGIPFSMHDIQYVPDFGVIVAVSGIDFLNNQIIDHCPVYDLNNLNQIAKLDVGSIPLAITYDDVGKHVYISPTDVDDNGMFIIEYNINTQLQTNYYQVAGLLASHALVVDANGEYIYAAVDDLSDQDTDEPYNNSSFNIQRIKILPEGTYDAINNFE